jgi:hypothetical protein
MTQEIITNIADPILRYMVEYMQGRGIDIPPEDFYILRSMVHDSIEGNINQ